MKKNWMICALVLLLISCEKEAPVEDLIVANKGEHFEIGLNANWSTGYRWSWTNRESISVADSSRIVYAADDPDLQGSPGTEIWTFEAISAGCETLNFMYVSAFSSRNEGGETKKIKVLVNAAG